MQGAPRPPSNGGVGVPGAAGASTGAGVASDSRGMLTSGIPADQLLAQQMSGTVPPAPLPSALPQWPLQQQYAPGSMALTAAGTTLAHQLQPQLPLEHEVPLAAHPPAVMPLDGVAVMLGSQDGHIAQLQLQQQTQQETLLAAHAHATALAAAAAGTAVPMAIPGPVGDDDCSLLLGQPSGLASPPSAASGSLGGVDAALAVQLARRQGRVRSQGSSTACFTGGAPGAAAGQVRASAVAAASLGSSRVSCGGGSGSHPGVTSCVSPRITPIQSPQASLQLHRAVSTAMAAAAGGRVHTAGHTATASAAPSCCSESDSSSDDDDDDYEFGEAKVKHAFSRQQRRERREARAAAAAAALEAAAAAAAVVASSPPVHSTSSPGAGHSEDGLPPVGSSPLPSTAAGASSGALGQQQQQQHSPYKQSVFEGGLPLNGSMLLGSPGAAAAANLRAGLAAAQAPVPALGGSVASGGPPGSPPAVMGPASLTAAAAAGGAAVAASPTQVTTRPPAGSHEPSIRGPASREPSRFAQGGVGCTATAADGGGGGSNDAQACELQNEFQGLSLFEDDDEDEGEGPGTQRLPWYRRPRAWLRVCAFSLSGLMLFAALGTQYVPGMQTSSSGVELWRWMYFFAAWPVLWVAVSAATNYGFRLLEWLFFREALYYLDSLRRNSRALVFSCLTLPWFIACFHLIGCNRPHDCIEQGDFRRATEVIWKLLSCLTLFCAANTLKALAAKLLSTHFYRTAHFKKVKHAIEKEYYLLMLSQPRTRPAVISLQASSSHGLRLSSGGAKDDDQGGDRLGLSRKISDGTAVTQLRRRNIQRMDSSFAARNASFVSHEPPELGTAGPFGLTEQQKAAALLGTHPPTNTADASGSSPAGTGVRAHVQLAPPPSTKPASPGSTATRAAWLRWRWWPARPASDRSTSQRQSLLASDVPAQGADGGGGVGGITLAMREHSILIRGGGSTSRSNTAAASQPACNGSTASAAAQSPRASLDATHVAGASGSAGGAARTQSMAANAPPAAVNDPLLRAGVLQRVNVLGGKTVDAAQLAPGEWERLRTAIAIKTFGALVKRYYHVSDEQEQTQLRDARRFARGLFQHVRGSQERRHLLREDFGPFFPTPAMADEAYAFFDRDNDGMITVKEMKESVTAVFKERKNMAASLKDTDSIVNTLEVGIGFIVHFVFAAIYLLIWGVDLLKGFSTFSATVLALTFVFGNSVRQMYEGMLYIFVEHAFDVGDLLEVEGFPYRVKKIDLLYVVLVRATGERVYMPTSRLTALPVINLTRTKLKSDKLVISLDMGSSGAAAREKLQAAVKEHYEENEADFNSCPSVNVNGLVDPFKVQLLVTWTYNCGADELKRMTTAKTGLLAALSDALATLPELSYTLVRDPDRRRRRRHSSSDEEDGDDDGRSGEGCAARAAAGGAAGGGGGGDVNRAAVGAAAVAGVGGIIAVT